jgi:hypothetical protein
MIEIAVANRVIYGRLHADSALALLAPGGVHENVAEVGSEPPYVVYAFATGTPVEVIGGETVWLNANYTIRAIIRGNDSERILPIAERIRAVLHMQGGAATGGTVYNIREVQPLYYAEDDSGQAWLHAGGTYQVTSQRA